MRLILGLARQARLLVADLADDTSLLQIVRDHLHLNAVPDAQRHKAFAELTTNMGQNLMAVNKFHAKKSARKHGYDSSCYLYWSAICHEWDQFYCEIFDGSRLRIAI